MEMCYQIDEINVIASQFLKQLDGFKIFAFRGELGAGKTTFISSLCKELGVSETVTSPTFSIVQEYLTADGKIIFHMDFYRINSKEEAIDAGIEDCLNSNNICFVEWPERAPEIFPKNTIFTNIEILLEDKRKLLINFPV
jgi:tRNA threonylcarbamoyladenosine biosynthesis protein TsaE